MTPDFMAGVDKESAQLTIAHLQRRLKAHRSSAARTCDYLRTQVTARDVQNLLQYIAGLEQEIQRG